MASLYTIGYQGLKIDAFLAHLQRVGSTHLWDTRDFPLSRFSHDFNRANLKVFLETNGISYSYKKELGVPKAYRERMLTSADIESSYLALISSRKLDIEALRAEILSNGVTVLMCMECLGKPCHRHFLPKLFGFEGKDIMASTQTGIEWTDKTWNPTTGCNKVSQGCKFCYAEGITHRFKDAFPTGFTFTMHPDRLSQPLKWRKPAKIFVNSMSDLFHEDMTSSFLDSVFEVMSEAKQHTYQILTKRPRNMIRLLEHRNIPDNVWLGVSVENQKAADERVDLLRRVNAKVRFLSCEPLLEPLKLNLEGIHWVIVGGESGYGARPMNVEWALDIKKQCLEIDVAFFFKQMSQASWGRNQYKDFDTYPDELQCRAFPKPLS